MMMIDVERHGLAAMDEDDPNAAYQAAQELTATVPATGASGRVEDVRVFVEVQRRFGGVAPRALLGGRFVLGAGQSAQIEVAVAGFDVLDTDGRPACHSRLWKKPFTVGLPSDFGDAVLKGLTGGLQPPLPPGILRADRAGFDPANSAGPIFTQAAELLRIGIAAALYDQDPEPSLRAVVENW